MAIKPKAILEEQLELCVRIGVQPVPAPADSKVGIARNVRVGLTPIREFREFFDAVAEQIDEAASILAAGGTVPPIRLTLSISIDSTVSDDLNKELDSLRRTFTLGS